MLVEKLQKFDQDAPVIVGGCGGSGTRVVAQILSQLNFHIGSDLNDALDNMWFTLLFLGPDARAKRIEFDSDFINKRIKIFTKLSISNAAVNLNDIEEILRAAYKTTLGGFNYIGKGSGSWPTRKLFNMLTRKRIDGSSGNFAGWGFKEPNTQVYLPWLSKYFRQMKYIQVIRHGLDMAFSDNRAQWMNWARIFDMPQPAPPDPPEPVSQLQYWLRSNTAAIKDGEKYLGERFLVLDFDSLCREPASGVKRILEFLEIGQDAALVESLSKIPRLPSSVGRYKKHDLSIFDPQDIRRVSDMGFEINGLS